jgi:hypothetical protein
MFRKYFGDDVDARNFHATTPDARLIGHAEFLANHGHSQRTAPMNCKKASFVNATTLMEIKSNFAKITSKDNGGDIFRHLAQEASAQLHNDDKEWVNYKFQKFRLMAVLQRMRSILRAGLISGPRAVMGYVKVLSVSKQLFLLEFETGNAALIPRALRQDDLPLSFRYYDPILQYVDGKLSRER